MRLLLRSVAQSLGSALGWWLGDGLGLPVAGTLFVLGLLAGDYAARRFLDEYGL